MDPNNTLKPTGRWILISAILLVAGCIQDADFDLPPFEAEMVIISHFNPDDPFEVLVTKTRQVLDDEAQSSVSTAFVEMDDGLVTQTLPFVSNSVNGSIFRIDNFFPLPGKKYTLSVYTPFQNDDPALGPAIAEAELPTNTLLPSIEVVYTEVETKTNLYIRDVYDIVFEISFDAGDANKHYYHIKELTELVYNLDDDGDTIGQNELNVDFFIDQSLPSVQHHYDNESYLVFDDPGEDEIAIRFRCSFEVATETEALNKLRLDVWLVSKEYYDYHHSISIQSASADDPFVEPIFIIDNIQGGRGNFSGYINQSLFFVID